MRTKLGSILRCSALATGLFILGTPTLVHAAEPSPADRTLARTLFEDGRALAKEGKFAEACPKLEESERLAPGIGTLFNLADCFESLGRTASAWSAFSEAADLARLAGQPERESVARERAQALKPRLSHLKVHLSGPPPNGLLLQIDGKSTSSAVVDTEIPVDAGEHHVSGSAPGKVSQDLLVRIEVGKALTVLDLPPFQDAPTTFSPPPEPSPPPLARPEPPKEAPPRTSRPWQKPVAIAAGGVALVAIGVGAAFGLKAGSEWSDAKGSCPSNACDANGYSGWESARSSATLSTVFFTTGAIAAAAGIVLWLTAPSADSSAVSATLPKVRWGTF